MPDVSRRLKRLRSFLREHELGGVVLATRGNVAWLTGGADAHVVSQDETAFCALLVTARQALLLADEIEAPRITAEEPVGDFTLKTRPWTRSLAEQVDKLANGKRFASDLPVVTGGEALPEAFLDLRAPLGPEAVRQYKALGRDCSRVMETVARSLAIGDSGFQVESEIARHLLVCGVQPYVVLVAFDDRLKRYRHPIPTANHLRKTAMLVICGRRHGLIASLTRLVHFGTLPPDLAARHEAVCRVETAMWAATTPGAAWGDAFKAGQNQYRKEGFAGEWKLHHQGGPTGYAGRDFMVAPGELRVVHDQQAVAWNPSITGTKSEDTWIVNGEQRQVVTACSVHWPTISVTAGGLTLERPGILVR